MFPEEEAAGAIWLGEDCRLGGTEPVSWAFRGGVVAPRDHEDERRSTGGPSAWASSASLTLGIADMENVDLWRLSLPASEWAGGRPGLGDVSRSADRFADREDMSGGEDSVIVRLRLGVDVPEGVPIRSPAAGRRSTEP